MNNIGLFDLECFVWFNVFWIVLLIFKDGFVEFGLVIIGLLFFFVNKLFIREFFFFGLDLEVSI